MRVGFTGTQRGMTPEQKRLVGEYLGHRKGEFHHGDCVGADADAHDIAVACGWEPVIHPPANPSKRAWKPAERIAAPLPYLDRNKVIVSETEHLVATPGEIEEQLRSGTWSTIRYARKMKRRIYIVLPNGHVKCEAHDLQIVKLARVV